MDQATTFQNLLSTQNVNIEVNSFLVNLALAAALSYSLNLVYVKFGKSLSNRSLFARNFVLITLTTTLIITIVKSSLALSLGLVGALSIVRFRAAIKEPEELAYLFLAIAVGLGFGAGQTMITIIAFAFICSVIVFYSLFRKEANDQNLNLTVSANEGKKLKLENIVKVLKKDCQEVSIRRFDQSKSYLEATFSVKLINYHKLTSIKNEVLKLSPGAKITFLENKNIF